MQAIPTLAHRACNVPMESTKPPWASKHAQPVPAHMGTGARPRLAALLFRPACARMELLAMVNSSSWIPLLQNVYANVSRENMVQQMIVLTVIGENIPMSNQLHRAQCACHVQQTQFLNQGLIQ